MSRLDHVALWVGDPDREASLLVEGLGMHVIERTDAFTLVGWDARGGKLTLFRAAPPRAPGVLRRIVFATPGGAPSLVLEGVEIEVRDGPDDLLGAVVSSADPEAGVRAWARLGLGARGAGGIVDLGGQFVQLVAGPTEPTDAPVLNHLAILVESVDAVATSLSSLGVEDVERVEAANTRALFVTGPDGVRLEYVEHRSTFALR